MVEPSTARTSRRRQFLVERYWPGVTEPLAAQAAARFRAAAAAQQGGRRSVRHLSSTLLPDDEVLLTLVEADSITSIRAISDLVAFGADRITESLAVRPSPGRDA